MSSSLQSTESRASSAERQFATVVLSTKSRCSDLQIAVESALRQDFRTQVLVIDDGSLDQTPEYLKSISEKISVRTHPRSTGYIIARNEGAELANGEFLFSIDDDAAFSSQSIVESVIRDFADARVGAVAIPYADVNRDGVERQRAPSAAGVWITDRFIGTAYAVRRSLFLRLGGFRSLFFHQGEESDFCIRMLDAGYFVRLGDSDRIDHFESPKRDTRRMDLYGRRNDILFAVLNVPFVFLIPHLFGVTIKGLWYGIKVGRPFRMAQGLLFGYLSAFKYSPHRKPVKMSTYLLFRRLRKERAIDLSDV